MLRRIAVALTIAAAPLAALAATTAPASAASCGNGTHTVAPWACVQVHHYGDWDQVWVYPRQGQCIVVDAMIWTGEWAVGEVCGSLGDVWFYTRMPDDTRMGIRLWNTNGHYVTVEWPS